uniref:Sodium/nucleoside cotransporter n=1 Tax=Steinernema glaseri TaxID=37863 RepID=A0A1I7YYK6_9BILA
MSWVVNYDDNQSITVVAAAVLMRSPLQLREELFRRLEENQSRVRVLLAYLCFALLNAWTIWAAIHSFSGAIAIICITSIGWLWISQHLLGKVEWVDSSLKGARRFYRVHVGYRIRLLVGLAVFLGGAVYVVFEASHSASQLTSLGGLLILIVISVLGSNNPARIDWRPVLWGLFLQFLAAFLILRTSVGHDALQFVVDQMVVFLGYTQNGTDFVYGFIPNPPNVCGMSGPFAYTSLPIIVYFGSLCSLFYYYGAVQWILTKLATFLQLTMGTTAAESLNAAASVFLGPTEAAVMMKIALLTMTESEILTTLTAGFSMISGSLFAIYIGFGACPTYILSANVMSAPAVLCVSKLLCPEVQRSKQRKIKDFRFPASEESSGLEAISSGAVQATKVIAAIVSNVIVFIAFVAFLDAVINYLAVRAGLHGVTFNTLLSYVFYPFAYVCGVIDDPAETMKVAQLIGTKTVLNEFIAYQQMSTMLLEGKLSVRVQ